MTSNKEIIDFVLYWLRKNARSGQEVNWTVAITEEHTMIISKVGGVTSQTRGMALLCQSIKEQPWRASLKGVYLAKTFTADGVSNHAEMCILAAADSLGQRVEHMKCASDNCEACAHMLQYAKVNTMNGAGGAAMGWIHPRGCMALGTTLNDYWNEQIKELDRFNEAGEPGDFKHTFTQHQGSEPQGGYEDLLKGAYRHDGVPGC
ncbi:MULTISPECIES: hypothetical protein [Streptomyces]|uniref:Uncharacterized protein n=2 Tax=Streptomyces TaxID=1883 RepID=A0A420V6U3_9ACTN|nr:MULTISPECIES: hypothetical protein [Streptomyces]KNE82460.1 hypothetical protein ADZ36_10450 [Streptomyces fradiae]OFA49470.1 hypothetical protein BEN35_17980 [Streptomyces fradiae]PQM22894.1 hypothetical protein Sfr7A_14545 [Streptomyces xinghaiensis]RKM97369.1 hypothetical protein SFRA_009150 [Streptomyces xinghaiensis]RNC73797.1 hypothetical protein DC095_012995 [Streptomyces xinghaiensis]